MLVSLIFKTSLVKKHHERKWGLQNYAIIIPIENISIRSSNKELNSLQGHDIAQNYRILHRVVQRLFKHNLKI
jgi:hypothetical protein